LRAFVERQLPLRGSILFRGFGIRDQSAFRELVSAVAAPEVRYRSGTLEEPRGGAGESSADASTAAAGPAAFARSTLHYARASSADRPKRLCFCCSDPGPTGAQIAVADGREVFRRLTPELRRRWSERGLMYVRHFGGGLDVPWSRAFGTSDWAAVEARCRALGTAWEWRNDEVLRLMQVCPAFAADPDTLERVWCNDAHVYTPGAVDLRRGVATLRLPRPAQPSLQVYHADGTAIRKADLASICAAFEASRQVIAWEAGDVLLLDNLSMAHAHGFRSGDLRLLVAEELAREATTGERDPMWS
jgi:hypothetical protein